MKPTVRLVIFTQSVFLYAFIQLHTFGCPSLHRRPPSNSCNVKIISGGARNGFAAGGPFIASPSMEVLSQSKPATAGNFEHFEKLIQT
jgi:hypothetical protein